MILVSSRVALQSRIVLLLLLLETTPLFAAYSESLPNNTATADTTITVDRVQVTAIKQGLVLRSQPVAASIFGRNHLDRQRIVAVKELSQAVPNFHAPDYGSRMTSSIYVRGLGARIDQPVVGMNIDNVPVMNKDCFDTELVDAERIELLRGPQSTLYGRNTMGGVINIYTLSPLLYEGVRLGMEYSSGASYKFRAASYNRIHDRLGLAVSAFYNRSGGLFENETTGEKCDHEQLGGARLKVQWRNGKGLGIDNTLSFSLLDQGGYPYVYIGEDIDASEVGTIRSGRIAYNDPCSYARTAVSNGLTIRYDAARLSVASITSYQYSDDEMILDQDFLPLSYFTLRQARREHILTEDLVFRSRGDRAYHWLFGAFGFYRHSNMEAPVNFKETGIDRLIFGYAADYGFSKAEDELLLESNFRNPSYGVALYHESNYTLGNWRFTAGIRADYERTELRYASRTELNYYFTAPNTTERQPKQAKIDDSNRIAHSYTEILPKFSVLYAFDEQRNLYFTVSKGYKAGGFNTQIFSDILQERLKQKMTTPDALFKDEDIMSYKPEYSWNYELGGHFMCMDGMIRGDMALFWIDCRDQQLTVFPKGQSTGRMMTNAGRTRSIGAELSLQIRPLKTLELNMSYGYTDARFRSYHNGIREFRGNRLPYVPAHTLSVRATWSIPTGVNWLGDVVLQAGLNGAGDICWNEENTRRQSFYALLDASVGLEHKNYRLSLWSRNLGDKTYDVFYFKSIGNEFVQRGRPRIFGVTLSLEL